MKEKIKVTCYRKTEYWNDREKAKDFYFQRMKESYGVERDGYVNIYIQLVDGCVECHDGR